MGKLGLNSGYIGSDQRLTTNGVVGYDKFFLERKRGNFNPVLGSVVRDGLKVYLDASEISSYPGSGPIWYDISGNNNNGSLINNPGFSPDNGGSFIFDGTNNKVSTNYGPTLSDFTICVWFKDNGSGGFGRVVDKNYELGFWLGRNDNTKNSWGGGIREATTPYGIYLPLTDGQWHFLTSIRSGDQHILYGNGIENTVSNTVTTSLLDNTTIALGAWSSNSTQPFKGNIAFFTAYDRALSTTEVLQNYNITKNRFN
jgi:hypothetical protein